MTAWRDNHRQVVLIITQVYVPDPAAVGQQIADAAAELAARGNEVIVITSANGYDDPSVVYPAADVIDGVKVIRVSRASLGKSSLFTRGMGAMLFTLKAALRGLGLRRVDAVLISTSPPLAPIAGLLISVLRRARLVYWVMDLNPDQAVALGVVTKGSLSARALEILQRAALRRASRVIVLDRYMAERVNSKRNVSDKIAVVPPWALVEPEQPIAHERNPFRKAHDLDGKFVVMHSGNHSPSNPLATLVEAAKHLTEYSDMVFLFIGGGISMKDIRAVQSPNVRALPYQPAKELEYSLAAADVHVVSVGDPLVGIVHPSKVYGAMAMARPILLLGPAQCHVADLLAQGEIGWRIPHGDVEAAERTLRHIRATDPARLEQMGKRARSMLDASLSRTALRAQICTAILEGS